MTITFSRNVDHYETGSSHVVSKTLGNGLVRLGYGYETATVPAPSITNETATRFRPDPKKRRK